MRLKDDVAALELLRVTLDDFEAAVNDNVTVKINQNQYDALVCFVFNIGVQAFKDSTLLRLLNEAKYYLAAEQFKRWCKETVNGKLVVNQGLENRRLREANLFCSP
jgi:lysozyme